MITGIKDETQAKKAFELGADAIGLLPFDNIISPEKAASITRNLPDNAQTVLVTHLTNAQEIAELASKTGVTTIEICESVLPQEIKGIKNRLSGVKIIKVISVADNSSVESVMKDVERFMHHVDAIELDTFNPATGRTGGTGKPHDWNISKEVVRKHGKRIPIILAGGLTLDNVSLALQTVEPFGLNVSSSVMSNHILDEKKLEAFLLAAGAQARGIEPRQNLAKSHGAGRGVS
ncbi:MAG: phosphoribosylanthranilate isomerase [Chloroflexota bacterium]|nr:phosphoribosylanthranilate isomerase [Chloroflexota bacterium]